MVFVLSNTFFHSQYLVSCIYLGISSSNILSGATGLNLDYDVKMYKLTYNTVDTDSLSIIATGAFFIPTNTSCTEFPFAVYNHGTTLRKNDVPSNNNPEAIIGKVLTTANLFNFFGVFIIQWLTGIIIFNLNEKYGFSITTSYNIAFLMIIVCLLISTIFYLRTDEK